MFAIFSRFFINTFSPTFLKICSSFGKKSKEMSSLLYYVHKMFASLLHPLHIHSTSPPQQSERTVAICLRVPRFTYHPNPGPAVIRSITPVLEIPPLSKRNSHILGGITSTGWSRCLEKAMLGAYYSYTSESLAHRL